MSQTTRIDRREDRARVRTPLARRALAASLLAAALTPAACQASPPGPGPTGPAAGSGAPAASSGGSGGSTYVTGAKTTDNACGRVVSAIGYLDFLLVPDGEESRQKFDDAVRGRFGYLGGVISMYGPRLPGSLRAAAEQLAGISQALSGVRIEHERRPGLLRDYREASGAIIASCKGAPAG